MRTPRKTAPPHAAFDSPEAVERFRLLARTLTEGATSSKEKSVALLQREGILGKDGRLTKRYAGA